MSDMSIKKNRFTKYPSPITLRFSHEEIERLDQIVSGSSRSEFIRKKIFGDQTHQRKYRPETPKRDDVAISQILVMMSASNVTNNLNQLTKAVNSGALVTDENLITKIEETYAFHLAIRSMLMKALHMDDDLTKDKIS